MQHSFMSSCAEGVFMQKSFSFSRSCLLAAFLVLVHGPAVSAATREITVVNYESNGVKQWLPGTIIVEEGDTVNLTLINKVPSGIHGFQISDFAQKVDVKKDE